MTARLPVTRYASEDNAGHRQRNNKCRKRKEHKEQFVGHRARSETTRPAGADLNMAIRLHQ
jgi:hypothetical protein